MYGPGTEDRFEPMKQRILVVEDEPSILDNIVYSLETDGFTVSGCGSGEEALELSRDGAFDLVIVDVGLPDMNGFDLCRQLRGRSGIPVIFLTARAAEVDRVVGLEIGADDYVVKPFSPRELNARIRAVFRRCRSHESGAATARGTDGGADPTRPPAHHRLPFVIDEERVQIAFFGHKLALSSTEFRLLRVFCRHPGRVYSRGQLMDLVWPEPGAAMERTVDAHVKSLRAKLRTVRPDIEAIETRRGTGYALKETW